MPDKGVLILINNFPPAIGGAEKQAAMLAEYFAGSGFEVHIVFRENEGLRLELSPAGVFLHRVRTDSGFFAALKYLIHGIAVAAKYRKSYSAVLAFQLSSTAIGAVVVGRLLRKYSIVRFASAGKRGDIALSSSTLAGRLKLQIVRRYSDKFIALSQAMKEEMVLNGFPGSRIDVIANTVSTSEYFPASGEEKKLLKKELYINSQIVVIYMGRLASGKGLFMLLEAWKLAQTSGAVLLIVGEGEERKALAEKAVCLEIAGNVIFTGPKKNIADYLRCSDIFVRFSESEGISNSLLEAMSTGLCCIASDVPGNNEVIESGRDGFLVSYGNTTGLSKCLASLIVDSKLRKMIGLSAREKIINSYSQENLLHLWKDVIK